MKFKQYKKRSSYIIFINIIFFNNNYLCINPLDYILRSLLKNKGIFLIHFHRKTEYFEIQIFKTQSES